LTSVLAQIAVLGRARLLRSVNMEEERRLLSPLGMTKASDCDTRLITERTEDPESCDEKRDKRTCMRHIIYASIALSILTLGFFSRATVVRGQKYDDIQATEPSIADVTTCLSAPTRREWRDLSLIERGNYIDAVLCLKTRPSRLGMSHSLYDDFPYIHNQYDSDGKSLHVGKIQSLTFEYSTFCRILSAMASILHPHLSSRVSG
jgi:hypothetical protein